MAIVDSEFCARIVGKVTVASYLQTAQKQPARPKTTAQTPDDLQLPFFRFSSTRVGLCRLGKRDWRRESWSFVRVSK
jgi:hypothetical protein